MTQGRGGTLDTPSIPVLRKLDGTKVVGSPLMVTEKGALMGKFRLRGFLYSAAKFLGDVSAVKGGSVGQRIARRVAGKGTGGILGGMFRKKRRR